MIQYILNINAKKMAISLFCFLLLFNSCYSPKLEAKHIQEIKSIFSERELEYFFELSFKNEIHARPTKLSKWCTDIGIGLTGEYTPEDSCEVCKIVTELNNIIDPIKIAITSFRESNLKMYFVSYQDFDKFDKYASLGIHGFFLIKYNFFHEITNGLVLINKNLAGIEKKSTIRNEISNSLGLINDSYKYPASAFQQFENNNITYIDIDKKVISLLYNYKLPTNMDGKYFKQCFLK